MYHQENVFLTIWLCQKERRLAEYAHDCKKKPMTTAQETVRVIWSFLQSTQIRRPNGMSSSAKLLVEKQFCEWAEPMVKADKPLSLFFYDLPFKTGADITKPDLSEQLMFLNLNLISKVSTVLYKPGLRFRVISDGSIFSLGGLINFAEIEQYRQNCRMILRKSMLKNVSIMDWLEDRTLQKQCLIDKFRKEIENMNPYSILSQPQIQSLLKRFLRCFPDRTLSEFENLLLARAHFEIHRSKGIHPEWGWQVTQHAHKTCTPRLCIYPVDSGIEISASRGTCYFQEHNGKVRIKPYEKPLIIPRYFQKNLSQLAIHNS